MGARPKHLSDLDALSAHVRIVCRSCGFEDDWTRDEFARHLSATGGSQVWSEVTRYLRWPLQVIRQRLSDKGWIAPTVLLEDARTWPWNTPAPPGWLAAPEPRDLEDRDG